MNRENCWNSLKRFNAWTFKMKNIKLFVHLYKKFPFPNKSEWIIPTAYESDLDLGLEYLCLGNAKPNISEILPDTEKKDEYRIGYLAQTIALEYWILHHLHNADYVGVTGYRRYPLFHSPPSFTSPVVSAEANKDVIKFIEDENQLQNILNIVQVFDVITPLSIPLSKTVREQFIEAHPKKIWDLFIECIVEICPEYKKKINWFNIQNNNIYFGPMGMTKLSIFKEYADSYIKIVSMMCQRANDLFIVDNRNIQLRDDRWIGYLAERYYPFFLFANNLTSFQVPTLFLTDPTV